MSTESVATPIEGAVVDLDGTVYRGDQPVEGAVAGIERLREAGIDVVFLSNKAFERRAVHRDRLVSFGLDVDLEDVVNSASIAADFLARHHGSDPVYVVGEEPLVTELEQADVDVTGRPSAARVVLVSMDRSFAYDTLCDVLEAFEHEPALYATNPDRTCPVADGEIPDAGAVIGAVEGLTGHELDRVLGKPSKTALETATDRLDVRPDRCLMIGDRLETDVRMGHRAGMTTVLVESGVTDRPTLEKSTVRPDYVVDSLGTIDAVLDP
ncbi:HAD-IIA family hydrolase [Natrarchaeobaculum sulfurireducens]|uniref:Phosphatase of the HAD superfamily n=1 Tax=Natrarchaeobaculum sulfurireducens TaxID=2044521 RepID=A0A346PB14_9EURY|nr:HAD-IIA family hydrolase [Natrarchaeobaculum sulfurireducens]AXR76709.1 Phosphatase of the HAD superfamily [Natrarchaeobaculum sulfurireducens]AXR80380.1 phosphoglycolate phosphatase [Natrarchaeobaculum sulfurireducens]